MHGPGKYRGMTLLSNVLKLLERVLDARIRRRVEGDFGEEQQGFRKGRGTADGMYILRQMVEKRLEVQGSMALGLVDLEKVFDTLPREMVMTTLWWMGVPEAEVRMVEGTYKNPTSRVVVEEGASDEFELNIGVRQGSVLSPLLFIAVMDLIGGNTVMKDAMKKLPYADDLAVVANGKHELKEKLEEWNGLFTRHGLKINVEKTVVLHRPKEGRAGHRAGGEETDSVEQFRVPRRGIVWRREDGARGTLKSTGRSERVESSCRVMVMSTCVTPACLYGTETLALTELQQQRLQVCENNWVRKIARVTRADMRRMAGLREETGVQRSMSERADYSGQDTKKRMTDCRLPKRSAELREQGRRRRGRSMLRWEDCVKRDVSRGGGDEGGQG